ncbi:hypothetical protein [Prosthecobacter vanneervenii]|uniref:Uncharacterized protein n=1 Tax=Prosthecobacter vanneervenii TaxID=48466 RepID=A0A7W7Y8B2_9BACT|nr:hypothetical protein [Prosthecobacter vanneervenii]MBB5031439.1 hypothetical protein [Prosthecobacter vanneervenii]
MFTAALDSLTAAHKTAVETQLSAWDTGPCPKWRRVAANIRAEVALQLADFTALLTDFATELAGVTVSPESGWVNACRRNQFRGAAMPPPLPTHLGRAVPIGGYAKIISESPSITLTPDMCEQMLRDIHLASGMPTPRETRILQQARLGRYVMWAAFDATHTTQSPFDHIPKTTDAVRTALGLGECPETETLILITYQSVGTGAPNPLHRPTIGEAGSYCWFRPNPDAAAHHGLTEPLPPNPLGLAPVPEMVHREINGDTLTFPLYLAV